MLVHVLRKMVGRCVAMEVGHPLRPTPIVFGGYLVGLYCSDRLAAVAVYVDKAENPPGYVPERAVPPPPSQDPAKGLAIGTSAPSNTNAAGSNTGVVPGQPLPPAITPPPQAAPTQSNMRQVTKDLVRDFNIKWVEVKHIISVEIDGAVKVNFMRSKIIDVTRKEQMFDNAPEEVKDNEGAIHVIDADVRKAYHEQTAALLKKKVDALELPNDLDNAPTAEEMLAVMNGVQADMRMHLKREGDLRLAVEQLIRMVYELKHPEAQPSKKFQADAHEGVTMQAPPESAYHVDVEGAKITP